MIDKTVSSIISENEKFRNAVDLFFGMNPYNKYHVLLWLYYAKNRWLKFIDNYKESDGGIEVASLDVNNIFYSDKEISELKGKNIYRRSLVAFVPKNLIPVVRDIQEISEDYAVYFKSYSKNIFLMNMFEPTYIFEICNDFMELSDKWYNYESKKAFSSILYRIKSSEGGNSSLNVFSESLSKLAVSLLDVREGSVYNPYSESCSFAVELPDNVKYYGGEPLKINRAIGKLNLLFNKKHEDSILDNETFGDLHYDYILSRPRLEFSSSSPEEYNGICFLNKIAGICNKRSVVLLSGKNCFYSIPFNSRNLNGEDSLQSFKNIVDNDFLEGVIRLPKKILYENEKAPFIFILNKNKDNKGFVRFIDASKCFTESREVNVVDSDMVMKLCKASSDNENVYDVNIEDIKKNNYILYPNFYINREGTECNLKSNMVPLKDILSLLPLNNFHSVKGRLFNSPFYKSSQIVRAKELEYLDDKMSFGKSTNENCIVFIRKPKEQHSLSYVITEGEKVFFNETWNSYVFRLDLNRVLPEYILVESKKQYFINQLERYGTGGLMMSEKDFLECKIVLPTLEQQKSELISLKEYELENLKQKQDEEFKLKLYEFQQMMHQRKHGLKQYMGELNDISDVINNFISTNDMFSKNSVVSKRFGTTLGQYLEQMNNSLMKMSHMIEELIPKDKFQDAEEIDIKDFLKKYCSSKEVVDKYRVVYKNIEEENIKLHILVSKEDLEIILDNLFTNAIKYGFIDSARKDYQLKVTTEICSTDDRKYLEIKVANNGIPVSKSISKEKLFVWGIGHGTGTGCCQSREIARHFGGDMTYNEFKGDPNGFESEFTITFPLV